MEDHPLVVTRLCLDLGVKGSKSVKGVGLQLMTSSLKSFDKLKRCITLKI